MSVQFADPLVLRSLTIPNRLFMAPMCQYSARDGLPNEWHRRHYTERALGGVGLVVVEATSVSPEGRISPSDLGLWNDEHSRAFEPLVKSVREAGCRIAVQLAHAGRKASTFPPWQGKGRVPASEGGWEPLAPSALAFDEDYALPRELSIREIDRVVGAFGAAARRAVEAGFDAVEIHAAHGYLIHQFLSPLSNRRTDEYGGDSSGRSRFLREVIRSVRGAVPDSMPVLIRVSATDWIPGGWDVEECAGVLNEVKALGLDFVDVSSGGLAPGAKPPVGPGYQVGLAHRIRERTGMPTGAVGLITTAEQADQILLSGSADAVSLGRLLLRDPWWPARHLPADRRRIPPQYLRAF